MSKRKFSLTVSEAEIVLYALKEAIDVVQDLDPAGVIPFRDFYVRGASDIISKLSKFILEVEE